MADDPESGGTWRRGAQVRWTDVAAPLHAGIMWLGLIVVAAMIAAPTLTRQGETLTDFTVRLAPMMRQPMAMQLVTASSDLVLLFFLWRIARRVADTAMVARFRRAPRGAVIFGLIGGLSLAMVTMIALNYLYTHGIFKPHNDPGERMFGQGPILQFPVIILTIAVIAPFVEEFYFRGILLSWLSRKIYVVPAAIVSAAIFALLHFRYLSRPGLEGWTLTGLIAVVGLVNATLAIRTRSLWPPFAFHAAYNGTLAGVAIVPLLLAQH